MLVQLCVSLYYLRSENKFLVQKN